MTYRRSALATLALLALVLGAWANLGRAAPPADLVVQILDQRGAPVSDAVVDVMPAGGWSDPIRFPWPMAMAQRNQQFVPQTLIIARGSTVAFPNLDQVRHSIYSFSKAARFTINLYGREQNRSWTFPVAGTVALGCNIHDKMRGYIRVVDTPFAGKTDANGFVRLSGIPAGAGTLTVWHPQLRAPDNALKTAIALRAGGNSAKRKIELR